MIQQNYISQVDLEDVYYLSSKQKIAVNIFWLGFIMYSLGYAAVKTSQVEPGICGFIQAIGLALFLPAGIYLAGSKIKNSYLRRIFIVYCFWILTVISRGIKFDYISVRVMLLDADYGIFLYFAPFLLFFPNTLSFYKKVFDVIAILGIFFIIYDIVFIKSLLDRSVETRDIIEHFAKSLSMSCGFITLTYRYHSNKRKLLAWGVMIILLLFAVYRARRGLSAICISMLVFSYLLFSFNKGVRILKLYLFVLIVLAVAFFINFEITNNGLFDLIAQRGTANTRITVESFFFNDLKPMDWIAGKGINGNYFCRDCEEGLKTNFRSYIETGYLQIILKGGIIMLALYLLITIPAIFLGIFYSKNTLAKASGIWIFISLISLYPATVNTFSLGFLLVWVSVGICYSKKIRSLTDKHLKAIF